MRNICWYKRMTSDYQRAPAAARSTSTKCARPRFCRNFFYFVIFRWSSNCDIFICVLVEKRSSGTQMILIFRYFHFIYIYMFVFIFIIIACELEIVSWWKRRTLTNFGERLLFLPHQSYQAHKWIHLAHLFVCCDHQTKIVGGCLCYVDDILSQGQNIVSVSLLENHVVD